jgi:hypothetical protein
VGDNSLLSLQPVSVDTCTLLNVLASGIPDRLLSTLSPRCMVSDAVLRESLYLRALDPTLPPERVDLSGLIDSGLLQVCSTETSAEESLYVELASELDDGEALSLALSLSRHFGLATDDRKATRIARERGVVEIYGTPEILQACSGIEIAEAIRLIEYRARFSPASGTSLRDWWLRMKV